VGRTIATDIAAPAAARTTSSAAAFARKYAVAESWRAVETPARRAIRRRGDDLLFGRTKAQPFTPSYIRKQTLVGAERYVTPELKEYETIVLNANERIAETEQALFRQICAQIATARARVMQTAQALARADVFANLAEVAGNALRAYAADVAARTFP